MLRRFSTVAAAVIAFTLAGAANAAVITGSGLTVDIRDDNGAIDTFSFGGSDFFNPGTPISNFGFQLGTDDTTFALADTSGGVLGPLSITSVTPVGSTVVVSGTYLGDITFTRTYSIVAGEPVLRILTELTNTGASAATVRLFENFDPDQDVDQGGGFATFLDVTTLGGSTVAEAVGTSNLTFILGDNQDVTDTGLFFIGAGSDVNTLFSSPVDQNGALTDLGTNIGYEFTLAPGGTFTTTAIAAAGLTLADARSNFLAAAAVPEPASLALLGTGLLGLGLLRRRRKATA